MVGEMDGYQVGSCSFSSPFGCQLREIGERRTARGEEGEGHASPPREGWRYTVTAGGTWLQVGLWTKGVGMDWGRVVIDGGREGEGMER